MKKITDEETSFIVVQILSHGLIESVYKDYLIFPHNNLFNMGDFANIVKTITQEYRIIMRVNVLEEVEIDDERFLNILKKN